jgi:hypothetical protein
MSSPAAHAACKGRQGICPPLGGAPSQLLLLAGWQAVDHSLGSVFELMIEFKSLNRLESR